MSESLKHVQLVQEIVAFVRAEFSAVYALVVLEDSANAAKGNKPPPIEGFVPDVYAIDVPTTMTVIGEAKTSQDIETDRSRAQIKTFIDFLRWRQNGVFILAVPLGLIGAARTVVNAAVRDASSTPPQIMFLHGPQPQSYIGPM